MLTDPQILRFTAFSTDPEGGNPAGVVLHAEGLDDADMLRIAAEVGYAETAFVSTPAGTDLRSPAIRYFSPVAEVPFCGHATIATSVALANQHGDGVIRFQTPVGEIVVTTTRTESGTTASFTSVPPTVTEIDPDVLAALLAELQIAGRSLGETDLHPDFPPRLAFAGNPHPVLVLADADAFDRFTFDAAVLGVMMRQQGWTGTVAVLHPLGPAEFEARNLFPVGSITEDPATGSAAAAFGGYLRELGLVSAPARVLIHQGGHVGRPGLLTVDVPVEGGIQVTGAAVPIPQ